MRELTFSGFLTRYVRTLSRTDTNRVRTLTREAASDNPRLREPLLLYAVFTGKADLLRQAAEEYGLSSVYEPLFTRYDRSGMEAALRMGGAMPEEYEKVWKSFQSRRNRPAADNDTKELIRQKVRQLQRQYGVTNYRIYTDLKLNAGNLNAWLKNGDSGKVSLNTARQALQYMKAYEGGATHSNRKNHG